MEEAYNELKIYERYNKEVLIEEAVKTTLRIVYDKGLLDDYDNANEAVKEYLLIEINQRRRLY